MLIKFKKFRIDLRMCPGRFSMQDKRCEGCGEVMDLSTPCHEAFIAEVKRWWRTLRSIPYR